jgi:nucleoside-diphosphate-sugar epimerase
LNPDLPFEYVSDKPYRYDVQRRIPNTNKAKDILGFEHEISLEESIDEVIEYMRSKN